MDNTCICLNIRNKLLASNHYNLLYNSNNIDSPRTDLQRIDSPRTDSPRTDSSRTDSLKYTINYINVKLNEIDDNFISLFNKYNINDLLEINITEIKTKKCYHFYNKLLQIKNNKYNENIVCNGIKLIYYERSEGRKEKKIDI